MVFSDMETDNEVPTYVNGGITLKTEEIFLKGEDDDDGDTRDIQDPLVASKRYKCNECKYSTRNKYCLKAHLRLHTGEQSPFKEWTNDLSLQILEEYKKRELLWNPKDPFYTSKSEKIEAWEDIVQTVNIPGLDVDLVQQKINSLLSSFRREKSKIRKANEVGRKYVSKWFAFKNMEFLLRRAMRQRNQAQNSDTEESEEEADFPIKDSDAVESEGASEDISVPQVVIPSQPKRSAEVVDSPVPSKRQKPFRNEAQSSTTSMSSTTELFVELVRRISDPETVYAQYIAHKLRGYTSKTRACVEHAISKVLFEADTGIFDDKGT